MAAAADTHPTPESTRYETRPGVEVLDFDNRLCASARLVTCGNKHYQLGRTASTIVECLQGGPMSVDEIYDHLQGEHEVTRERLELALTQLCAYGILKNVSDPNSIAMFRPRWRARL